MKICIQSDATKCCLPDREAYRIIKESGFEAIDWNLDSSWNYKELEKAESFEGHCIFERSLPEIMEYYKEELAIIRESGLEIAQAHAPFRPNIPGRPDFLDYAISIYKKIVLFCDAIGCKNLVVHGVSMAEYEPELTIDKFEEVNRKLYSSLIPELLKTNVTVCAETLFCTNYVAKGYSEGVISNPYLAKDWIDRLNEMAGKECFGICLDSGHLHLLRKSYRGYIPVVGNRIKALHIHDNSQDGDLHVMPYTGTINWEDFLTELKKIGYDGDVSFETFSQIKKRHVPIELVPDFMQLMAKTADYFRRRIKGEIDK